MKEDLQLLARSSGRTARIKAGRLAALMKLYNTHPRGSRWMRDDVLERVQTVRERLRLLPCLGVHARQRVAHQGGGGGIKAGVCALGVETPTAGLPPVRRRQGMK